jgi:hypothetical protein
MLFLVYSRAACRSMRVSSNIRHLGQRGQQAYLSIRRDSRMPVVEGGELTRWLLGTASGERPRTEGG